jgi:hypothetical protein
MGGRDGRAEGRQWRGTVRGTDGTSARSAFASGGRSTERCPLLSYTWRRAAPFISRNPSLLSSSPLSLSPLPPRPNSGAPSAPPPTAVRQPPERGTANGVWHAGRLGALPWAARARQPLGLCCLWSGRRAAEGIATRMIMRYSTCCCPVSPSSSARLGFLKPSHA